MAELPNTLVGHWYHGPRRTGCTVILPLYPAVGGVWIGGGAPGTRETDVLSPLATVNRVDGLLLAGGSAFGLAAADGVMRFLAERRIGYSFGGALVPIVPGAVIFDLDVGDPNAYPDSAAGYGACHVAVREVTEGAIGVGAGATVGKIAGVSNRMLGGIGVAADTLPSGGRVGVLAVVNCVGSVVDETGSVIAGANDGRGNFYDSQLMLESLPPTAQLGGNSVLVAITTDVALSKAGATRVARMAHDGLARAIVPVHTSFDGDVIFTLSIGEAQAALDAVGAMATRLVATAIRRAVRIANAPPAQAAPPPETPGASALPEGERPVVAVEEDEPV